MHQQCPKSSRTHLIVSNHVCWSLVLIQYWLLLWNVDITVTVAYLCLFKRVQNNPYQCVASRAFTPFKMCSTIGFISLVCKLKRKDSIAAVKSSLRGAPPTAAQTGSWVVVVTLEENGCSSDFFSMKILMFQFHFVFLYRSYSRPLCNLEGKSVLLAVVIFAFSLCVSDVWTSLAWLVS